MTDEGEVLTKHEDKEQNIFSFYNSLLGNVLIERSQSICMNCIYLDLILWIWTMPSQRRKFGKQLDPYLLTKPQDRMAAEGILKGVLANN